MALFKKSKVALALGGGSARGLANVGVLKVLEREKVPIDCIVGSSIGALIGTAHSLGVPTYRMEEFALKFSWDKLADFSISKTSLMQGKRLEKTISEIIDKKTFKDTRIPMVITTTNLETGEEEYHTKGDLQKLVQASCSWPGIFPPVIIDGKKLVDGGIRNSVPVKAAKKLGATKIIAVELGFCVRNGIVDNIFQAFIQSIQILGEELDKYQSMQADVVIKPRLKDIDQFAFHKAKEAIRDGEDATERAMPEIRKKLGINLWKR